MSACYSIIDGYAEPAKPSRAKRFDAPTSSLAPVSCSGLETQRQRQNRRAREIKEVRKANGLCVTCGKKVKASAGCQCAACADKGRIYARNAYRGKMGIPMEAPILTGGEKRRKSASLPKKSRTYKHPLTQLSGGVKRVELKDGYGRVGVFFLAGCSIKGKIYSRKFSVDKYGYDAAKLLASMQRLMWLVEGGVWRPQDGDPLALLSYTDVFAGNRDYQDCEVANISSPWIQEYE